MATKEEYLDKLKTQLDSWQVEADALQAKAEVATDELKVELDKQLADLRVKFSEGETKLGELADATEEMWDELKVDAEAAFDKLVGEYGDEVQEVVASAQGLFAKIKSLFIK